MSIGNVIWAKFDLNNYTTEHRTLIYKSNKSLFAILLKYMN